MPIGAAIAGGGLALGGAVISSNAAKDAAKAQTKAANKATDIQKQMFDEVRAGLSPFSDFGKSALPTIQSLLGLGQGGQDEALATLRGSPGYNWAYEQGLRGVTGDNRTKGLQLSGAQVMGAEQYGQGMADQLLNQYFGQLMQVAGLGQNAAAGVGNAAVQTGQGMANTTLAAGQAQASGIVGSANAWTQGINDALSNSVAAYGLSSGAGNPSSFASLFGGGGGSGGGKLLSDVDAKEDITLLDPGDEILAMIRRIPSFTYRYKADQGDGGAEWRIGPMAQDWAREAGNDDDKAIPMPQLLGVMFTAIQELDAKLLDLETKQAA